MARALPPMACPRCAQPLVPARVRRGVAWICRACRAGAMTLPVLQELAPRAFALDVWQAARRVGRPSALRCPSCAQPFLTLAGTRAIVRPTLEVCCRCAFVWYDGDGLRALPALAESAGRGT